MHERQTKTERLCERIGVLMSINRKLRIEMIKVVHENKKLRHEKIIW
jgi:hypothetical protein